MPSPRLDALSIRVASLIALLASFISVVPATAQVSVLYADGNWLGEIAAITNDSTVEPSRRVSPSSPLTAIVQLPDGDLAGTTRLGTLHRVDPESFALSSLADPGLVCLDLALDEAGNLWCTTQGRVHCLTAGTYAEAFAYEDPDLYLQGVAAQGDRLVATAFDRDGGPILLVELDPRTGVPITVETLPLPSPPYAGHFWSVHNLDFDAEGGLWLGMGLYFPAIILPPGPEGYLARLVAANGAFEVESVFRFDTTYEPSIVVQGTPPGALDIPTTDPLGLALLALLLAAAGWIAMRRR